ncbi:MAG TPA: choice-of-anchor F family protein, partial [Geoalkalibacter subterraneus]|nr:choice-of-anchor F family protein [Geoalkalibacter subterraneus]
DVPVAFFYDGDNDPATDAELMATCEWDYDPDTLECLGEWVTYRGCIGLDGAGEPCDPDGVRKTISQSTIDQWTANPQWEIDYFDDVANLTLNYFITVDRKMNWPTPQQFVLRINTVASGAQDEDPTEPGDTPTDPGDDPTDPPAVEDEVDVAVTAVDVPRLKRGQSGEITVTLNNQYAGTAEGLLTLVVTDNKGNELDNYAVGFSTPDDTSSITLSFPWAAPSERTTVTVTATAEGVAGEKDLSDNSLSAVQRIN